MLARCVLVLFSDTLDAAECGGGGQQRECVSDLVLHFGYEYIVTICEIDTRDPAHSSSTNAT